MSLVFTPIVSDKIVVVVVDMQPRAKPPARLSSPFHAAPDAVTTAPARALARPSSARQSPDSAAG
jgi:hypothetical protein